jgi:hypothetical protein
MVRNQENKTKPSLGGRNFDSKLRAGLYSRNFEQIESVYLKISLNNKLTCCVDRDKFAAVKFKVF